MHFVRSLLVLSIVAGPVVAAAQRPPNIRGSRVTDVGGRGFALPRSSDLEDHSPVGVVLDKKKKLALTDSQLTALKTIAKGLHDKNADFYRMWDSVRVAMRSASGGAFGGSAAPGVGGLSPADQERAATARTHVMGLMRTISEMNQWSRQETLKVLTPEQQTKAEEFWKQDAEDFRSSLPGGGMPGGRMPGGRMPGGGRPPGS